MASKAPAFDYSQATSGLHISAEAYLSAHPHIQGLMTGTIVFRHNTCHDLPQVLLLRRAPTDSNPGKWEVPGGSVEPHDATLLSAAARELNEETGLVVRLFVAPVLPVQSSHPMENHIIEQKALSVNEDHIAEADGLVMTFKGKVRLLGKATLLADVEDTQSIVVNPEEHDEWAWVDEKEASNCLFRSGRRLEWVSDGMRRTVLQAFRLKDVMNSR